MKTQNQDLLNNDKNSSIDERRYERLLERSKHPIVAFILESFRQDHHCRMARVLIRSFSTAIAIPRYILIRNDAIRDHFVRRLFRKWGEAVCRIGKLDITVTGSGKIDPTRTYLFASNHISPVDVALLHAKIPKDVAIVANKTFLDVPVFSYWIRECGAVLVEQGSMAGEFAAFKEMIDRLKHGRSLLLFPEGFVNQSEKLAEFKRGGLTSAIIAHVPIVPVCISGTGGVIQSGTLLMKPGIKVTVEFDDPIDTDTLDARSRKSIDTILRDRIETMRAHAAV